MRPSSFSNITFPKLLETINTLTYMFHFTVIFISLSVTFTLTGVLGNREQVPHRTTLFTFVSHGVDHHPRYLDEWSSTMSFQVT